MVAESLRRVVNDNCLGQIPTQNVQVLDIVPVDADAMLPEEAIFDPLPVGVQQVQELVCVHFLRGREQGYFVLLRDSLEELYNVRSGSDKHLEIKDAFRDWTFSDEFSANKNSGLKGLLISGLEGSCKKSSCFVPRYLKKRSYRQNISAQYRRFCIFGRTTKSLKQKLGFLDHSAWKGNSHDVDVQ